MIRGQISTINKSSHFIAHIEGPDFKIYTTYFRGHLVFGLTCKSENISTFRPVESLLRRGQGLIFITLADGLCEDHLVLICYILIFSEILT